MYGESGSKEGTPVTAVVSQDWRRSRLALELIQYYAMRQGAAELDRNAASMTRLLPNDK